MTTLVQFAQIMIAQAQTEGGEKAPGGMFDSLGGMLPLILMFGVIYMLLIRPASKQRKQHAVLLNQLVTGNEVVTNGGIYGKIVAIDERVVTLEISDKVKIRILRDRIAGLWNPDNPPAKK